MIIRETYTQNVINKSNLPVCDYALNPYVGCAHGCKYCYACFMKRFTGHDEPWGEFLDVKTWNQPQEELYCRTRAAREQLRGSGAKLSIATKSDHVLRDLELIKSFPDARVSWSVNSLNEEFRADMTSPFP